MKRLALNRFLSYILGNWLKQSQNTKKWSFDVKNDIVIAQSNETFWIFERVSQTASRKKERIYIYIYIYIIIAQNIYIIQTEV